MIQHLRRSLLRSVTRSLIPAMLLIPFACGDEPDASSTPVPSPTGSASPTVEVPGRAPTAQNLQGIWQHETQPSRMIRFGDGTFAVDAYGAIDQAPRLTGTYEIHDRDLVVTVTGGGACGAGDTWTWGAGLPPDGRLQLVFTTTGVGNCAIPVGTEWSFIRLSPRSAPGAALRADPAGGFSPLPADPEEALAQLDGLWLLERGGHLLRLRSYGTYAIDDAGLLATDPYDVGTVDVAASTLTLVSVASSNRCLEGDRLVLEHVRLDGIGRTLRATVGEDSCSHDIGTDPTWIRLSP